MLVFVIFNTVAPFTCFSANRSHTLLEQVYDEVYVLLDLRKFPVCFLILTSLHRVFFLLTSLLQILPSLHLVLLVARLGAFAGLSVKSRRHSCLITCDQVVSFRNQYGASWFDASSTRGGGIHFGYLAMDRFQIVGDWEQTCGR